MSEKDGVQRVFDGEVAYLEFHGPDGIRIGALWGKGGKLSFEGNAEASAQLFFDHMIHLHEALLSKM